MMASYVNVTFVVSFQEVISSTEADYFSQVTMATWRYGAENPKPFPSFFIYSFEDDSFNSQ